MPGLKAYIIALAVGVLVGVIYGLLNVRSPAPPLVALVGLLGILLGEQIVPIAKTLFNTAPTQLSNVGAGCVHHLMGPLPGGGLGGAATASIRTTETPERPV
jgi:XapX domain-containing protein